MRAWREHDATPQWDEDACDASGSGEGVSAALTDEDDDADLLSSIVRLVKSKRVGRAHARTAGNGSVQTSVQLRELIARLTCETVSDGNKLRERGTRGTIRLIMTALGRHCPWADGRGGSQGRGHAP